MVLVKYGTISTNTIIKPSKLKTFYLDISESLDLHNPGGNYLQPLPKQSNQKYIGSSNK